MCAKRLCLFLLAAALAAGPPAAVAQAAADLQVHGFLSQGWVLSQGNNVNGTSDDKGGSGEFRELGVNASWRPLGPLLVAGQLAAVEAGRAIDEDIQLEYGLLDYTAFQGAGQRLGLRGGKLKLPIGFYNDSRDAVFTRPGVILPNSVYLETNGARAFGYFSGEGAALYGDWYAGDHTLYAELFASGDQTLDDAAEIAILRRPAGGRFDLDSATVLRLSDDYDGGRWRAALSLLDSELSYVPGAPAPADPFDEPATFNFRQAVVSLQYNAAQVSVTTELVARHIELTDISSFDFIPLPQFQVPPIRGTLKQDPGGWYVQGAYRLTPKWQALLRYDEQIRDLQDRHGYDQSALGTPRHYFFARDWTAGARYDVLPNLALWAEFHYVDGVGWVNPLDNPTFNTGDADRYWNLFTVMLGLRF
jgi:hypothetical protein